jgi:hypothetical protein
VREERLDAVGGPGLIWPDICAWLSSHSIPAAWSAGAPANSKVL